MGGDFDDEDRDEEEGEEDDDSSPWVRILPWKAMGDGLKAIDDPIERAFTVHLASLWTLIDHLTIWTLNNIVTIWTSRPLLTYAFLLQQMFFDTRNGILGARIGIAIFAILVQKLVL